jgi:hypothetical protein
MAEPKRTSTPVANEQEVVEEFPDGQATSLREQRELVDETGADIREYTGEPVDTGSGVVIPQQMAVGEDRVVGAGEFHDDPGDVERSRPEDEEAADEDHPG